jgi:hypothetical protein
MDARVILAVASAIFLVAAAVRVAREGGRFGPAARTRLLVGAIFGAVAAFLWFWH